MEFIATFGFSSPLKDKFVRVQAETYKDAMLLMLKTYDAHWAFLYLDEQEAGVARWSLTEVPFGTPNTKEDS